MEGERPAGQAGRLAPEFFSRYGARPLTGNEAMVLLVNG